MERHEARAGVYLLLASRLYEPDESVTSGEWARRLTSLLQRLELDLQVPESLMDGDPGSVVADYEATLGEPGARIRLIESLFKPWTADPGASLLLAREKGWLGGDSAAHMRSVYAALGIAVPPELAHAPDHLALELEFMGLLIQEGTPEQQRLFRSQHLDWVGDLLDAAIQQQVPAAYQDLFRLIHRFVALDSIA